MADELAQQRRELPWVAVEKEYRFETDEGTRRWRSSSTAAPSYSSTTSCSAPSYEAGCPVCSSSADSVNGVAAASARSRRDDALRLTRAAREAPGLQEEDGLELPLGLLGR